MLKVWRSLVAAVGPLAHYWAKIPAERKAIGSLATALLLVYLAVSDNNENDTWFTLYGFAALFFLAYAAFVAFGLRG
jgi:hypothetical protein